MTDTPEPDDYADKYRCPDCDTPTWPGWRDGHTYPRRCLTCQQHRDHQQGHQL